MTNEEILSKVDHTLLKPDITLDNIRLLCNDALLYNTASVCIPPGFVKAASKIYHNLNICTVIGFPLGYQRAAVKKIETEHALNDGANEIDMVINITCVKDKDWDSVLGEIVLIKDVCKDKILKVIIETCYLAEEEKIRLCQIVTQAGADYIKTSTGFGTAGATLADIELFKKHIGPKVKIKAAGGIKTRDDMVTFINAGACRLGTSSAVKILSGENAGAY